jgi:hypothetical protein
MPDPSLHRHPLPHRAAAPRSPRDGGYGAPLAREYRPAPSQERPQDAPGTGTGRESGGGADRPADGAGQGGGEPGPQPEDNPFAPPPEGAPDRPWQPRHPQGGAQGPGQENGGYAPWGSQWSDRQPGRAPDGGFGDRPRRPGPSGDGPSGQGGGMRWDPTDPAQRRARYALLSGMWAFFFALFGWRELALLLGALALYWGVSALRAKPHGAAGAAKPAAPGGAGRGQAAPRDAHPAPAAPGTQGAPGAPVPAQAAGGRSQRTAAVSGLVTAGLALAMVALTFTAQLVYRDYYTCVNDALTTTAKHSCERLLPHDLRTVLGDEG